jgi:anti-sigma regulatory factor (Ser/Thr protein kinase)
MTPFRETVRCGFDSLGPLRSDFRDWLAVTRAPASDQAAILLAVHEAAANAIEHSGSGGPVAIGATLEDGSIVAEVSDTGSWKTVGPSDERGRGLALIAGLVSQLEITPRPGGTSVRMVRVVGGEAREGRSAATTLPTRARPPSVRRLSSVPRK